MKRIALVVVAATWLAAGAAHAVSIGAGAFVGASIPVVQDDNSTGTQFGLRVPIGVAPLLSLEPYVAFSYMGDASETFGGFEYTRSGFDGTAFDVEISTQYRDRDGGRFVVFIRDITDRKRVEEELRLAHDTLEQRVQERSRELEKVHSQMVIQEKMASVGLLAAGIAHELNNPLNFVSLNFVTLSEYFDDMVDMLQSYRNLMLRLDTCLPSVPETEAVRTKEAEMQLDFILNDTPALFTESRRGFERIARIIKSMRDFSYVNHSGDFTYFNINDGIEDTLIIARNEYKYIADVTTDLGNLPEIRCLPEQLNQVFLNLIVNSAHAIQTINRPDRGRIMIRTWHDNSHVYCDITDDGPGIPEEIQNRIFEPFFTTKPPGRGTGLGLSICYDIIVEKHQGNLTMHCPESGGTVFSIAIPNNL